MNTLLTVFTMFAAAAAGPLADARGASDPSRQARGAASTPLTFTVDENAPAGTSVGNVTFGPRGSADRVEYHLAAGNALDAFQLDRRTGRLTVRNPSALDFELRPVTELIVEVRKAESGADALRNSFQARLRQSGVDVSTVNQLSVLARVPVTVRLRNVDDGPAISHNDFRVREDATNGTVLGTLGVSPGDAARNLAFSLLAGNDYAMFGVDRRTGQIRLEDAALLDFEQQSRYRLTVEVADSTGARALVTATICVDDVNEPPLASRHRFRTQENAAAGSELGAVRATDPDRSDVVRYEFVAGDKTVPFDVDRANGRLRVTNSAALDFAKCPRFDLTIRAFDVAGADVLIPVVVELTEYDAPAIAPHPFQTLDVPPVPEWAATGGAVGPAGGKPDAASPTTARENSPLLSFALFGVALVCLGTYTANLLGMTGHGRKDGNLSTDEWQDERSRIKARIVELETVVVQLEGQRDELIESNGRLETERTKLTEQLQSVGEQQTQLKQECDRVLAEADAVSQMRALLEQQRKELDGERARLDRLRRDLREEQGCLRGMLTGGVEDLDDEEADDLGENERFEFDDVPETDGPSVATGSGGGAPATVPAVGEARLDDLRSNLATAFGVSYSDSQKSTVPAKPAFETAAGSTVAVEDGPAPEETYDAEQGEDGDSDNIAAYMQALLNRTRRAGDSTSSQQWSAKSAAAATTTSTGTTTSAATTVRTKGPKAIVPAQPVPETAATTETAAKPAPARLRPTIDKHAVRQDLDSFRQVAILNTRSALNQHLLKRRKRRMVVAGMLGTVSLIAAAILLPAGWWGGASVGGYGWAAAGVALLMAVEFCRLLTLKYRISTLCSDTPAADASEPQSEET